MGTNANTYTNTNINTNNNTIANPNAVPVPVTVPVTVSVSPPLYLPNPSLQSLFFSPSSSPSSSLSVLTSYFSSSSLSIREYTGHRKPVRCVAWNCFGNKIASGSSENIAKVYFIDVKQPNNNINNSTNAIISQTNINLNNNLNNPPNLPPTSNQSLVGSSSTSSLVSSTVGVVDVELRGHNDGVDQLVWHPYSGEVLATASADQTVKIWDANVGKCVSSIPCPGENINIAWSQDGKLIAVGNKSNTVSLIDCRRWSVLRSHDYTYEVNAFEFSRGSDGLLLTTGKGTIEYCSIHSTQSMSSPIKSIENHVGPVYAIASSPDGIFLASGGADAQVSVRGTEDFSPFFTMNRLESPIRALSFSFDNRILASASEDHKIDLAAADNGALVHTLSTSAELSGIAFSPRHMLLAYATDDKTKTTVQIFGATAG